MSINSRQVKLHNLDRIALLDPNHENFDFELWAIAVRNQMLAVLKPKPPKEC